MSHANADRVTPCQFKKTDAFGLKIKRGALFLFGFVFFLFPGQNWYVTAQATYQPPKTQGLEVSIPFPAAYPVNNTGQKPPSLTARSVVVVDQDSAVLIYGKNEKVELLPASTVKIMTALVVFDYYNLDDLLVVGRVNRQGQDMELISGENISVENLLYGLLVASANDAALVLAQNYPGGKMGFVTAMNQKAKELNLNDTYFANPTGLDSDEGGNFLPDFSYTTALDLARLASWALKNKTLAKMVATRKITVNDVSGKIKHQFFNLNELLGYSSGVKGIKTGWTEEAGECLVSLIEQEGRKIITVVLGSEDRFGESAELINWVFENHRWESVKPILQ